jgi:hypothetical protein
MKKLADLLYQNLKVQTMSWGKVEGDIHTYTQLIFSLYIYYANKQTNLLQYLTAIILIPTI